MRETRKVLITDHPWPKTDIERSILEPAGFELIDAPNADEETLIEMGSDVFAIMTCWGQVTERVIRSAEKCRLICRMGIGLDNIDIETATERKIQVTNVPDYCVEEVADHSLALLLALARNVGFFHLRTKNGDYDLQAGPPMFRLKDQRLGLIGFGRIARAVYQRAVAFGLEVVATSPSGNSYGTNCPMIDLHELLATSHLVSIHAPLNEKTHHLIDQAAIDQMRDGVIIANTSRGPLIEPEALLAGLQSGRVHGAGLDVFEPEPPDLSHPLYQHERVIVTPHAAFVSQESLTELRTRVARQIVTASEGEQPENIVNDIVMKI